MRSLFLTGAATLTAMWLSGCGTDSGPTAVSGAGLRTDQPPASPVAPAIGVSPSRLSFLVYAFRSQYNPPTQTLRITNLGGWALTWTARDNAYWLKFGPTSGTTPTTLTVRVDRSAIPIGLNGYRPHYLQGGITVSTMGATNTPLTVPVWLTISYVH